MIEYVFLITDSFINNLLKNHEVCAVLGISQLKRLDSMIEIRRRNYKKLCLTLEKNFNKFFLLEYQLGNNSFCFPIICKDLSNVSETKGDILCKLN